MMPAAVNQRAYGTIAHEIKSQYSLHLQPKIQAFSKDSAYVPVCPDSKSLLKAYNGKLCLS